MELDPGTFDVFSAAAFREAGVTRASIGVQSFDDTLLHACGRGHNAEDACAAVQAVQKGGFEEVSVDLMSGLPGDTLQGFESSLQQVTAAFPAGTPSICFPKPNNQTHTSAPPPLQAGPTFFIADVVGDTEVSLRTGHIKARGGFFNSASRKPQAAQ
jgi:hypothetical protein